MKTILMFALPIIIAWVILSVFYQGIVRKVLCDAGRFALFRLRDELRRLAVEGHADSQSFAYKHLELLLCRMIDTSSWISISSLIELQMLHPQLPMPPDIERFEKEANAELRQIREKALNYAIGIMTANSPGWTLLLVLAALTGTLFGWAGKQWLKFRTAILLEQEISDMGLQVA
jgi:hypothetical protein